MFPFACGLPWIATLALAQSSESDTDPLRHLEWRSIGPINMSGRVADVEGLPGNPRVLYVGSASGGVWKTTNGGHTFESIFDDQPNLSTGDMALAPSNPDVIYVGTGEANVRNSVSFGQGVFRSTDGGQHWSFLGLEKTRHISRIAVDSADPDTVLVGALGSVHGPGPDRGVYRSEDAGATWERTLFLDDYHGVSDLDQDLSNPNIVFAGMWRFERKPWTHRSGSEEGGLFKSIDGGKTWREIEEGLPKLMGRIAVKIAASNPSVVYVMAESHEGTLFRSDDRGETFTKVSDDVQIVSRGFYYTDLRVDPTDENRVYAVSSRMWQSIDGGKTFERIARTTHVDHHSLWIDPLDPDRMWMGQDGGIAVTYDRGETWEPIRNLPLGQYYQVFATNEGPFYRVGGGLQDNGTWIGPSRTREGSGVLPDLWSMFSFGDAYFVVPHPTNPDLFLSEYQAGGILRTNLRTRQQWDVNPQPRRNDGGPIEELPVRYNWNAPIVASPHDAHTVYFAGNYIFRSRDFGDTWETLGGDLTTNDPEKMGEAGGPAWTENTTAEYHCTVISFAESPVQAGLLWAGTDDGNLQVSADAGETWTNRISRVGVPEFSPVSHIEPSTTSADIAYVSFDRHMFDDYAPHLFRTHDRGLSWRRIGKGLPEEGWIWVVREDPVNPAVVYVGTEVGLYLSRDSGESFQQLTLGNLPAVSVHDILIHPTENDLILGTHGRGIWILDDATPIQKWTPEIARKDVHLFDCRPALRFARAFTRYGEGDKKWVGPNPAYGALLTYSVSASAESNEPADNESEADDGLRLEIVDERGEVIRTIKDLATDEGLHRVAWDLTHDAPRTRTGEAKVDEFAGPSRGPEVLPGKYIARLTRGETSVETTVEVRVDPMIQTTIAALREQHEMALTLGQLISTANDELRGLDSLREQTGERRETMKRLEIEPSDQLKEALEKLDEGLTEREGIRTRLEGKPFWSQGPRLVERLEALLRAIEGQYSAPGVAQKGFYEELRTESNFITTEWEKYVGRELPVINELLEQHGIPPLVSPVEGPDQ